MREFDNNCREFITSLFVVKNEEEIREILSEMTEEELVTYIRQLVKNDIANKKLFILKTFATYTDESSAMSAGEISEELSRTYDIYCDEKSTVIVINHNMDKGYVKEAISKGHKAYYLTESKYQDYMDDIVRVFVNNGMSRSDADEFVSRVLCEE